MARKRKLQHADLLTWQRDMSAKPFLPWGSWMFNATISLADWKGQWETLNWLC